MPSQYNMSADTELYRGILEFEFQPQILLANPHYDPNYVARAGHLDMEKKPWAGQIYVPDGPVVTNEEIVGPYHSIAPIKSYVSRNRGRYLNDSLRIKRIERVSAWEEVEF